MAKLYLISPPKIELAEFLPKLEQCLETEKVDIFQLRLKDASDEEIFNAAINCIAICHKYNVKFILNDSATIAKECDADGVHVGDDDDSVMQARKILGAEKLIGKSCYNSIELALNAVSDGADLVSFGAFFPTKTKIAKSKAELKTLQQWKTISKMPCSVIGGMTPNNCTPLVDAGADYVCVISYVWDHPNPAEAVANF